MAQMTFGAAGFSVGLMVLLSACALAAALIAAIRPVLERHALARPEARSSHKKPTPQGAGIAVIASTIAVSLSALAWTGMGSMTLPAVFLATGLLVAIGAADDVWNVNVALRLLVQAAAIAILIVALPAEMRALHFLPLWLERLLLALFALWFVNLTNFMDGIDWMTVAEVVPVTAAIGLFGLLGIVPAQAAIVALALCGAMLGFAPFNKPVARLFLGDVGSLPIGLLLSWLAIVLATSGHLASAILLPLYYFADATITLARRALRKEAVWRAHREHFYQRAFDRGVTPMQIVAKVFAVNAGLALLALAAAVAPGALSGAIALGLGAALVAWLLRSFAGAR